MMNNSNSKALTIALLFAMIGLLYGIPASNHHATSQTTTTSTATTGTTVAFPAHFFNPNHFLWRSGHDHPHGIFLGTNRVLIPSTTLQQSVVNNCPPYAPVLLSTGACVTEQQALQLQQSGQLAASGTVQAYGQVVVGTPIVINAHGFSNPNEFFHHFHH